MHLSAASTCQPPAPLRLRFLGTAAAEAYPAPFCNCHNCRVARRNGGRDLRRRTSVLVNDDLLLDFSPDVFAACQALGVDLTNLQTLCIGHNHDDHLAPENLAFRTKVFVSETELPHLSIYAAQDALDRISTTLGEHLADTSLSLNPVSAGATWVSGDYTLRALPAVHATNHECLLYLVERGGHRFLYGTDTGPLSDQAWQMLAASPPDVALLDSTMGRLDGTGHMGIGQVKSVAARLRQVCGEKMPVVAYHFSHHTNPCYEELVRIYGEDGIRVAYDGMLLDLDEVLAPPHPGVCLRWP
jgi:phosphoribosyl 1,2-cyclic phosphate phosphodiesterase